MRQLALALILAPTLCAQWIQNPANGHHYTLTSPGTWLQTEAEAVAQGGHLATVRSASENAWLVQNFGAGNRFIGLTDEAVEGSWVWVSGEPVTFLNWDPGQPNSQGGNEDYCLMWTNGLWHDYNMEVYQGIIERIAPLATYAVFGAGCIGPTGAVPSLDGVAGEPPRLGSTTRVEVTNLPLALTIPVFFFGRSNTMQAGSPSYPLPANLGVLGWPGCEQLVSADVSFFEITNTGQAEHAIDVPLDLMLVGQEFHVQVFALYFPTGVAVSNGLTGVMGF